MSHSHSYLLNKLEIRWLYLSPIEKFTQHFEIRYKSCNESVPYNCVRTCIYDLYHYSSYNHVIYGNRAQAYLNLGKDHLDHARLDALRAVVLQSLWPKVL